MLFKGFSTVKISLNMKNWVNRKMKNIFTICHYRGTAKCLEETNNKILWSNVMLVFCDVLFHPFCILLYTQMYYSFVFNCKKNLILISWETKLLAILFYYSLIISHCNTSQNLGNLEVSNTISLKDLSINNFVGLKVTKYVEISLLLTNQSASVFYFQKFSQNKNVILQIIFWRSFFSFSNILEIPPNIMKKIKQNLISC